MTKDLSIQLAQAQTDSRRRRVDGTTAPFEILVFSDQAAGLVALQEEVEAQPQFRAKLTTVSSVEEGAATLASRPFDVALLCLSPCLSSGEVGRVTACAPKLPVVAIGPDDEKVMEESFLNGAQDYIVERKGMGFMLRHAVSRAIEQQGVYAILVDQANLLRASEANIRAIIEASADAVFIVDRDGLVQFSNPAAETMFGRGKQELFEQPFGFPVFAGQRVELDVLHPDGSTCVAEMRSVDLVWNGEPAALALLRDVTERKRAEEEIQAINAQLEQRVRDRTARLEASNRDLESFAYSISHDLGAPLRHINSFSDLLLQHIEESGDSEAKGLARKILQSSGRMQELIVGLLEFSRLGRAGLSLALVNLNFLVERVVDELSHDTAGRRVEFKVTNLPKVTADPLLLRQVLVNLLSNALKFSRLQDVARIEIDTCQTAAGQTVVVRDNGIGFDMAYAAKLFGVFQRLHSDQRFEGTGIGLAIAQRIITKHGGRMWAESAPGKGASFFFTLGELQAEPAGKDDPKSLRTSAGGRR